MGSKTRHVVSFVLALLKTLEEDLKQQPVYQDCPKDVVRFKSGDRAGHSIRSKPRPSRYTAGQLLRTDHKLLCSITLSET
ncbi:hypothetical protein TNCV_3787971 [Trichonephila clavipes]|nr:hypothetical protein TNCV_3787971 [Trichonephila clavipes]